MLGGCFAGMISGMKLLPNLLTFSRCIFAAMVLIGLWKAQINGLAAASASADDAARLMSLRQLWFQFALLAFASGALTDLADGAMARFLKAESAFGVWFDPVADKILVGFALVGLAVLFQSVLIALPAGIIIARDIFMTWLRSRPEGQRVMSPSRLAKWKTAIEMFAVFAFLVPLAVLPEAEARASGGFNPFVLLPLIILWGAAALSSWTGWVYLRAARS